MDEKYEKAIEMLMKNAGLVWYEDEWIDKDEAYYRSNNK